MIRSELKTLAKALLNERGDYFAANIDVLCDLANRIVYGKVAQLDPEQLDEYASFTYPADAEFVALTGPTYLNERPLRVLGVDELSSSAYTVRRPRRYTSSTLGMHQGALGGQDGA